MAEASAARSVADRASRTYICVGCVSLQVWEEVPLNNALHGIHICVFIKNFSHLPPCRRRHRLRMLAAASHAWEFQHETPPRRAPAQLPGTQLDFRQAARKSTTPQCIYVSTLLAS